MPAPDMPAAPTAPIAVPAPPPSRLARAMPTVEATVLADRVVAHPDCQDGKAMIEGSVLRVDLAIGYLATMTPVEIERDFKLQEGDVLAAIRYAAARIAPSPLPRAEVVAAPRLLAQEVGIVWRKGVHDDAHRRVRERLKEVWPVLSDALERLARYAT